MNDEMASSPRLGTQIRRSLMGDEAVDRYLAGPVHAVAPEMTRIIDQELFGEIWRSEDLTDRERVLVTMAGLATQNLQGQLRTYARVARNLGIEQKTLAAVMVQLAFYIGFPAAANGLATVIEETQKDNSSEEKQ